MSKVIEKLLEVILVLGILYLTAGCQTANGISKDMQDLWQGVDKSIVDK